MTTLYIVKPNERYAFVFDDDSRQEMLRTLGRFASNPELGLTWYDAAKASQEIRNINDRRSEIWVA